MICNHGQIKKYHHDIIGCNSRLDSIQAAILNVKLKYLDSYNEERKKAAKKYNEDLKNIDEIETPKEVKYSTHVYHQYTLKINNGKRDELKSYLNKKYSIDDLLSIPLYKQRAFKKYVDNDFLLKTLKNFVKM